MTPDEARRKYEDALAALPPQLQEMMRELSSKARPRPKITAIFRTQIEELSAEDVEPAVVEFVERLLAGAEDRVAGLRKLPRGVQIFYLSFLVEAEGSKTISSSCTTATLQVEPCALAREA